MEVLQRSYMVEVGGNVCKRHQDQLRPRHDETSNEMPHRRANPLQLQLPNTPPDKPSKEEAVPLQPTPLTTTESYSSVEASSASQTTTSDPSQLPCSEQPRRNPPRNRKPPERYGEV